MSAGVLAPGVLLLLIGSFGAHAYGDGAPAFPDRKQPPGAAASWLIKAQRNTAGQAAGLPIELRPATLADGIDSLAGLHVRLTSARVVGVFDPRVFLVDTESALPPLSENRKRVLVFVESGRLRLAPRSLVGSTVTVTGTARTLLGAQASGDVPWPARLTRESLDRLDVRAALLATSVSTPEGVDLLLGGEAPGGR